MREIDLNSDLGEGAGHDEEILSLVSSVNIACGFHAGTAASIFATIRLARKHEVAVGAHPSFDDRANFGRAELDLPLEETFTQVAYQVGAFRALCLAAGTEMRHVKPHGALYNMAARDRALADAVAHAVLSAEPKTCLFVLPGSELEKATRAVGLQPVREFFADRNYLANGSLVPRSQPDALLHDPMAAAERVVRMLRDHVVHAVDGREVPMKAETICVHGDTPDAVKFVRELRTQLERNQVRVAAPPSPA